MIIYKDTIFNFVKEATDFKKGLIAKIEHQLFSKLGRRVSPSEKNSWETTLIKVARDLKRINNSHQQHVLLEFKLPFCNKRIDLILCGSNGQDNSLLILELKGWDGARLINNPQKTYPQLGINTRYRYVDHPAHQTHDYYFILNNYFDDLKNHFSNIKALAILPNYQEKNQNEPLRHISFEDILKKIDLYTKSNYHQMLGYFDQTLNSPIEEEKVNLLNRLEWKPTADFSKQLKEQFNNIVLIGSQRKAYFEIKYFLDRHLINPNKTFIIISGHPGSGKTVVAIKILGYILAKISRSARLQLPTPDFRDAFLNFLNKRKFEKGAIFANMIGGAYAKAEEDIQIIDEAHKARGQGYAISFFESLFKHQKFVIALIDDGQVISKQGISKEKIIKIANSQGFVVQSIELEEQFRNQGDYSYIDWLKNWIFNQKNNYQEKYHNLTYQFDVLDPNSFQELYQKYYQKYNTRLMSFWTQSWNANFDQNGQPLKKVKIGNHLYTWNPNWAWKQNFEKNNPHQKIPSWFLKVIEQNFNTTKKGSQYVGYFNSVQGYEFEYVFVHLPKLFYLNKDNQLDVDLTKLDLEEMKSQIWMQNKVPNPLRQEDNKLYFKNRLLVNLTRGTKGTFIYCDDPKLANWIKLKILKTKKWH